MNPIDFKLDRNNDLVVPIEFVRGLDAVAQGIRVRVRLVKGELFSDLEAGVDWYGVILGQRYNGDAVRDEIRAAILDAPGVARIVSLSTDYDSAARTLSISWRVTVDLDGLTGEVSDAIEVAA